MVDQGVEALVNQVFHSDLAGDEGLEVNLAGLNQLDGLGVGVHVCDGAADIELLEHNLLNIQRSGLTPNGDDDDLTGGLEGIQDQVQCGLNGGALERDVSATAVGQLVNLSQNVGLCGGESVVSNTGVQSLLAAQRGQLRDNNLSALSLQNCGGQQTDGASTGNQCECALFELACTLNSVVANAQGLNQCSLVQGNVVRNLVNPAALDGNLLGQTATATCQADEVHVLGQVVVLGVGAGVNVITNEKERSMWAAAILAKMLPKGHLFGHRIAFFLRADNELYQTINTALIRLEYFDIFKNTDEHIERLNHYQPTIVVAPASMLIELSKRLKAGDLSISPQKIVSVAEILEDSDRIRISSAFKLPIIDQVYQATEGFLACTCSAGHLHLNEDIIFVEKEYLDERRFYPVITDFKRSSQPVYRYKLNDILVENPEPCSCGSHYTRIDKVEGRSDDIFYFEGQDGGQVTIYPDFIRRCILFVENVGDYQVKQHSEKLVEVCLSRRDEQLETAITEQFRLLAQQKEFKAPEIRFSDYHWDTSRKLKRIQRL